LEHEGTIDKFSGDGIMAWFNAPITQPDHPLQAVRAALSLRDSIKDLHAALPESFHMGYGIGIHGGESVLGLIGTEKRWDYTAIGDSVNTAKRIQENAMENQILISKSTYEQVKHKIVARALQSIQVKGKSQPIEIFEVIGEK
ncbi:MAG: adenylate/guanylate cyclase domain-containing protein, partial [Gammaproteobacteria bacterium]|nr:adenylate/guanylate cyclase domain-containing protein [candidate division Zixibacteria bacterium]NIR92598.1 adenylate/guanylate cyclase domain-containing protein [Gammaproteobacteria bacterium]NIR66808.1 adenylate/guanylate cyclase domain-containing protein [candidate division Zixibacteria bacterium]NIS48312.1 adenylate/guanylate cyclase domain-containing protein [candidate division Zixibacteria bacterium]NIT54131.1 adenylate/guanylate cyclase domain-containing protein [candidate division Zi